MSLAFIKESEIALEQSIIDVEGEEAPLMDHLFCEYYSDISVLDISSNALLNNK